MIFRNIYNFLSSSKLAMALLVAILVCCIVGVTVVRGERAGALIFSTLWFNGILVLLVINVACCFFPRMLKRKLTIISAGMILFHLSFVAILGGIVYNSLFYFRGLIRLTEGETLPSGDPRSYDNVSKGRFFDFSRLEGETTLIKMHKGYKVNGADKQVAYEVSVGDRNSTKHGIIYITHKLVHEGFDYFRDKEGFSILVILYDKEGRELYGAHIPMQSLKQKNGSYLYTTGTKVAPGNFPFPQPPQEPLFALQAAYNPDPKKERGGKAIFKVWSIVRPDIKPEGKPFAEAKSVIGEKVWIGEYYLLPKEIRYWVGMNVRHEPGKPFVLTSLWVGFAGILITFIGRLRKGRK